MRRGVFLGCLFGLVACGSTSPVSQQATGKSRQGGPSSASAGTSSGADKAPASGTCRAPSVTALSPDLAKKRDDALVELARGRFVSASQHLERVLDERPHDLAAFALRSAADTLAAKARVHGLDVAARKPVMIDEVPQAYALTHALDLKGPVPKLHLASKTKARFGFTDWFLQHGIQSPDQIDAHDLNAGMSALGQPLAKGFRFPDHRVYVFGTQVVAAEDLAGESSIVFDFRPMITKAANSPPYLNYGVVYARVVGTTLLAEICAMGIESTPATPNAFLAAVDITTGRFSWVSEIRVAGAQSFIVTGGAVIASAGMTNNPGRVVVVELATGKVLDHIEIPFAPFYVVPEGREVLVQGGESGEVTFHVDDELAPAPPASLPPPSGGVAADPPSEETLCGLRRAIVALDARDGASAASALSGLPEKDAATNALRGTADFLVHEKEHPETTFDLTSTTPIALALTDAARPPRESLPAAPVLSKKASGGQWPSYPPSNPLLGRQALADDVVMPSQTDDAVPVTPITFALPDSFGSLPLTGSSAWPSGNLVYYGSKYVVTSRGTAVEHVFDISALEKRDPTTGVRLHLGHMELAGERLLLSFSHRGPSTELGGQKDFIAAFDRKTGAFLWRSDYLVSTMRFTTRGDYAIAAWGYGTEPGNLYVIRLDTGETVSKQALSPTPYEIGWASGDLFIENDGGAARYSVR